MFWHTWYLWCEIQLLGYCRKRDEEHDRGGYESGPRKVENVWGSHRKVEYAKTLVGEGFIGFMSFGDTLEKWRSEVFENLLE